MSINMNHFFILPILLVIVFSTGCAKTTFLKYSEFVTPLDDKSELSVKTYPAFFPKETFHIPFLYREFVTHDKLYFQVFVRDKNKKAGPNPNIDSIEIHSFSYKLNDHDSRELISGFKANFWMQGQHADNKSTPIQFHPEGKIEIDTSLTINGKELKKTGVMKATTQSRLYPLIFYSLQ